jgi:hypothetical protein
MKLEGLGSWRRFPKWKALGYTPHVLQRVRKRFILLGLQEECFEESGSP